MDGPPSWRLIAMIIVVVAAFTAVLVRIAYKVRDWHKAGPDDAGDAALKALVAGACVGIGAVLGWVTGGWPWGCLVGAVGGGLAPLIMKPLIQGVPRIWAALMKRLERITGGKDE